jgi:hypothetical protein
MADKLEMEFKHYTRLTPQLISSVCNAYQKYRSKEIIAYEDKLRKQEREEEAERNKPSPEKQLEIDINGAIESFDIYRLVKEKDPQGSVVNDWGNIRYDFLDKLGIIPFTPEEKNKIAEEAKKQLISEKRKELRKVAEDDFKQAMHTQTVKKAIAEINGGGSALVISTSKQIALDSFYDSLIEQKEDFGNLLKKALFNHKNPMYKEVAKKVL